MAIDNDRAMELVRSDCLFSTDNLLEIPTLRLELCPKSCSIPFVLFGEQKRTYNMKGQGTLCFYADDYRFNSVYEHPEKILKHNPMNIVEPNFSLFNETPVSFGLQQIYKKRWIGRAMQEAGLGVFVDLNVANKFYQLNMIGVPKGYSAFCTRGYSDRLHYLEFEFNLAKNWASGNDLLFVIYGGGEVCKRFAEEHGCVYVTPAIINYNKRLSESKNVQRQIAMNAAFSNGLFESLEKTIEQSNINQLIQ